MTGAGGFIGAHLVRALLARGWRVAAIDDLSLCHSWWRLGNAVGKVRRFQSDVLDALALERAARDVDVVFHHAGLSSAWPQNATLREWHAVNVTAVLQVMEVARFAGASRFVLSDTCATDVEDVGDDLDPAQQSFDVVTRRMAGEYARYFAVQTDLDTTVLSYAEVYGPMQVPLHAALTPIASLVHDLMVGNVPLLHGDEHRGRDFIHIDDVVAANLLAADAAEPLHGTRYAIATGRHVSMRDVARETRRLLGQPADVRFRRSRRRPPFASRPDVGPARDGLRFDAQTTFERGLRQTIDWQRATWG